MGSVSLISAAFRSTARPTTQTQAVTLPSDERLNAQAQRRIMHDSARAARGEIAMEYFEKLRAREEGRVRQLQKARPIFDVYTDARAQLVTLRAKAATAQNGVAERRYGRAIEAMDQAAARVIVEPYSVEERRWSVATNDLRGEVYRAYRLLGVSKEHGRALVLAGPNAIDTGEPLSGIDDVTIFD